jgi:hypothetical protein
MTLRLGELPLVLSAASSARATHDVNTKDILVPLG